MARPVSYNLNVKKLQKIYQYGGMPEGYQGEGFFATQSEQGSWILHEKIPSGLYLLPLPVAVLNSWPPWVRIMILPGLVAERVGFSPRQCDLLMVMGTIAKKMGPVVKQVYLQMAEPRWVLAVGACACSGGIFDTYSVLQGIDQIVPVDVYIPGCPPRPEAIIDGFMRIQDLVGKESLRRRNSDKYKAVDGKLRNTINTVT